MRRPGREGPYRRLLVGIALGSSLLAGSCARLPTAAGDRALRGAVPPVYAVDGGDAVRPVCWWESFNNAELDRLMAQAMGGSLTLRQAWARLDQARAAARRAGADRYPSLSVEAGASTARSRVGGETASSEEYSLGLAAGYEVDGWGRVRAQRAGAVLDARAAEADVAATAMTLAASVAETWVGILERRADRALLAQQLESNRTYLDLLELRLRKSMATVLDVEQQRQIVAQVESQIPLAEAGEQALVYELAFLLGKASGDAPAVDGDSLPDLPALPDAGLPADLLIQRPDVHAALYRLESAAADVVAARADRLPSLQLTAGATYRNDTVRDLLDDWYANLAASLIGPLLDGGRRAAEEERTRAVVEERLAAYRAVVLDAVREVETALTREAKQQEYLAALEREIAHARNALREATERQIKGQTDFLRVLTATLSVQARERESIAAHAQLLVLRIGLYRALGGSWPLAAPVRDGEDVWE